jgi:hypothetical protein
MMAGLLETVSIFLVFVILYFLGQCMRDVRRGACVFGGGRQLDLDAVDAVDAINEEDQDEDKGDLQPVLDLGHNGVLGDEAVGG